ncbi:MAG: hypothetical protein WC810_26140 [Janthinobacterium sp.]|jgi:hypothetical protein
MKKIVVLMVVALMLIVVPQIAKADSSWFHEGKERDGSISLEVTSPSTLQVKLKELIQKFPFTVTENTGLRIIGPVHVGPQGLEKHFQIAEVYVDLEKNELTIQYLMRIENGITDYRTLFVSNTETYQSCMKVYDKGGNDRWESDESQVAISAIVMMGILEPKAWYHK